MSDASATDNTRRWWGEFELAEAAHARWRIGPLHLAALRNGPDWLIEYRQSADPLDSTIAVELPADGPLDPPGERWRFALESAHPRLCLQPALADRPVSVRPKEPVWLPPGQSARFFVSTPLWLRLTGGARGAYFTELPTFRPSDTWFGAIETGELCYATRTRAHASREELPSVPHRAVTPVKVINKSRESLPIERLKLPMPNLPLYVDSELRFSTPAVEFVRESLDGAATMRVTRERAAEIERVADARIRLRENRALQVFERALRAS